MTDIIEHETVEELVTVPTFGIAAHTLRDMLTAALVASGKDGMLPSLYAVRLEWDAWEVRAVSTDRYRLLVARVEKRETYAHNGSMYAPGGDGEALLSRPDVVDLVKVLPKLGKRGYPELVKVSVLADSVLIEGEGWSRTLRQVDGAFPKYRSLIPTDFAPTQNIAFNPAFIGDIGKLPVEKGTAARFSFVSSSRPAVAMLDGMNGVDDYTYLLMPIRVA